MRELLEAVGVSDLRGGMGRDRALGRFSRLIDGCSTREVPRGLNIPVSVATVGREPVERLWGLGG